MVNTLETYMIHAHVLVEVSVEIKAESLEDAVAKSKELTETDFVKIKGEYMDGDRKIRGIWQLDSSELKL